MTTIRWTTKMLEALPEDETKRYEIIDGELFVSTQPSWGHQVTCSRIDRALGNWCDAEGMGEIAIAPGIIFSEEDAAAPDLVWVSRERLPRILETDGKLHAAPDLVVEVLSPGAENERRDRTVKLRLYSLRGVREYWIVNWRRHEIDVYRRDQGTLQLVGTMVEQDTLESPLLPGFRLALAQLFAGLPAS